MTATSNVSEAVRRVLAQPNGGVVGLVDDLLRVCWEYGLHLESQAGRCRIRSRDSDWEELANLPLRKSIFGAILARIAALCNAQTPGSASPYGGQDELSVGQPPAAMVRVAFVNTSAEQTLVLAPGPGGASPDARCPVLPREEYSGSHLPAQGQTGLPTK